MPDTPRLQLRQAVILTSLPDGGSPCLGESAVVTTRHRDGTYTLEMACGETVSRVPRECLLAARFSVGDRVRISRRPSSAWCTRYLGLTGTVTRVRNSYTRFDLDPGQAYPDGCYPGLPLTWETAMLQPASDPMPDRRSNIQIGDRVRVVSGAYLPESALTCTSRVTGNREEWFPIDDPQDVHRYLTRIPGYGTAYARVVERVM